VNREFALSHRKEKLKGVLTMQLHRKLEEEVSKWLNVSVHPHRFGGMEFRFRDAEVGHVHTNGILDIPLPRSVRDALLAEGLAEEHHWVPNSGWITFKIRSEENLTHALWLMRLSYLRYALKTAIDPRKLFEQQSEELGLNPHFKSLIEPLVPETPKQVSAEPVQALSHAEGSIP
jgi:luciferase-like monooxygenase